jgi:sigma-B regulation protein RsbU (phosphoserine phosphatase)
MEQLEAKPAQHPTAIRDAVLRGHLLARRQKLQTLMPEIPEAGHLVQLLQEVDSALDRMEGGTYGICETCHDPIEPDRLLVDPLCRNCIDHLSAAQQRALERDLDLAFQVQRGLLPQPGLTIDGWTVAYHYEPVGPVSGDYCDLIPLADGGLFIIGDVMGKGVAASMLMAQLHAIFRSLASATSSVGELLAKANRIFCEGTLSSFFATVLCGRIGTAGAVEISNAGHCLPWHVKDGRAASIESTGLPLGLFCDGEYTSRNLRLDKGDSLVLYSDGLTEAFNPDHEQYGTRRLARLLEDRGRLSPQELLAASLEDQKSFRAGAPATDDLTLMVLRREH